MTGPWNCTDADKRVERVLRGVLYGAGTWSETVGDNNGQERGGQFGGVQYSEIGKEGLQFLRI